MNWVLILLVSQVFTNNSSDASVTAIRFHSPQACQSAGQQLAALAKNHKQSVEFVCQEDAQ